MSPPPEDPPDPQVAGEPEPSDEPRQRRTHSERREEAERRILAAAVKIVAERGLQDLTLAECGQAAGYSRGLAAHYFGSREELLGSIARYVVDHYRKKLRAASGRVQEGRSALDTLLDSVSFYIRSNREDQSHTRAFHSVLGAAFNRTPLGTTIAELNRSTISGYATIIRRGIDAGVIRADVNPSLQAALIVATLRGVVRQWMLDPNVDLDVMCGELINNLRRSLAA